MAAAERTAAVDAMVAAEAVAAEAVAEKLAAEDVVAQVKAAIKTATEVGEYDQLPDLVAEMKALQVTTHSARRPKSPPSKVLSALSAAQQGPNHKHQKDTRTHDRNRNRRFELLQGTFASLAIIQGKYRQKSTMDSPQLVVSQQDQVPPLAQHGSLQ